MTEDNDLSKFIQMSRKIDNNKILDFERIEFERTFNEIMNMVRLRYKVNAFHEDDIV